MKDTAQSQSSQTDIRERILNASWFHTIDLGDGFFTPGRIPISELKRLAQKVQMPASLDGQRVLDIGAWDGYFSFEAERRGAKEVLAADVVPIEYTNFALAKEYLGSKATYKQISVYDLDAKEIGQFDTIFFFGVWYHLRYPVFALDKIWDVLKPGGHLYVESACLDNYLLLDDEKFIGLSQVRPDLSDVALLQFYRLDQLNPGDFSNWFSFSSKAAVDLLQSAGFDVLSVEVWSSRMGLHAVKTEGLPEYKRIVSYEALGVNEDTEFSEEEQKAFQQRRSKRTHIGPLEPVAGIPMQEQHQVQKMALFLYKTGIYKIGRLLARWKWIRRLVDKVLQG